MRLSSRELGRLPVRQSHKGKADSKLRLLPLGKQKTVEGRVLYKSNKSKHKGKGKKMIRSYGKQKVRVITKSLWAFHIDKPIYGTCVAIRDRILEDARKAGVQMLLTCPGGKEIVNPSKWMKSAKRIEKVFLIPEHPMVLYQGFIKPEMVIPEDPGLSKEDNKERAEYYKQFTLL